MTSVDCIRVPLILLALVWVPVCSIAKEKNASTPVQISLRSIYFTSGQHGFKPATASFRLKKDKTREYTESYGESLQKLFSEYKDRTENIFLTQGDSIHSAVEATHAALLMRRSAEQPVSYIKKPDSKQFWLAAYLGRGGAGAQFIVTAAERDGRTIRLSYVDNLKKGEARGLITFEHYYWVPLGELERGPYVVELHDAKLEQVVLHRRVTVP